MFENADESLDDWPRADQVTTWLVIGSRYDIIMASICGLAHSLDDIIPDTEWTDILLFLLLDGMDFRNEFPRDAGAGLLARVIALGMMLLGSGRCPSTSLAKAALLASAL
ncbi:hypothetical protein LPJ75_006892 [Coemansia sp. RSA 2598]|nr:hypothetical protein LPJ75_006892 [Coemansia sp. RSA 2598]